MEGEDGGTMMITKADIDTSAPFRSVKEAVALFGESVLAGEIHAKIKLKQNGSSEPEHASSKLRTMTVELEETKEALQKARDEGMLMATCFSSLQQELERTKRELQQLKQREEFKNQLMIEPEIDEYVKHVENTTKFEVKTEMNHEKVDFQKKQYVKFANPPSLAKFMVPQGDVALERHPSLKKKKKKPLIPLIGGIFSRKKGSTEIAKI